MGLLLGRDRKLAYAVEGRFMRSECLGHTESRNQWNGGR